MSKNFADRLTAAIDNKKSCLVVGLDPRVNSLPPELKKRAERSPTDAAEAVLDFNKRVIEAVAPYAVAVKPQVAFYESLGWEGYRAFADTIREAKDRGLIVISDVKRGDIGSTAEAYAEAHLDRLGADAVTVNPYLGADSIAPFLKRADAGKGIFVLVKTSNASSSELQDLVVSDATVYEKVAQLVEQWGEPHRGESGYSAACAVVGATFPEAAEKLRTMMPHTIFLVPGYGAQGGGAEDCRPCFDNKGHGAIVNSSRGIIFAYNKIPEDAPSRPWEELAADAARKARDDLERVRQP